MLNLSAGIIDEANTKELRRMKRLKARSDGSLPSSVESAGYYAQKQGQTAFVYLGNSFGHAVWRVSFKKNEYLNGINNTGSLVYSVGPDLTLQRHEVER